jgi:uncharacterized protein
VITYFDTSVLLKLILDDEQGVAIADDLWMSADVAITVEIAWAEARAALAAAHRARRLTKAELIAAKEGLDEIWAQLAVVAVTTDLVRHAGDLAEANRLRGYDAVHLAAALRINADVVASADHALTEAARAHGRNAAVI